MNLFNFYIPEWVFVAINLVIITLILRKVLWNRVGAILDKRQETVAKSLADAQAAERALADMNARQAAQEEELERLTLEMMSQARGRAGSEYDRIVSEAETKAQSILASAEAKAARSAEAMLNAAKTEIVTAALAAAEALIAARMDAKENQKFVESFLAGKGVS